MGGRKNLGLVLTGGGARGAYQAGAIRAICEIANQSNVLQPFPIITGISAGAINAGYLASHGADMYQASVGLAKIWENLKSSQVFRVDGWSLAKIGVTGIAQLLSGGKMGASSMRGLLDTRPLRKLIEAHTHPYSIRKNLEEGKVKGVAITAVNYSNGFSQTFYQTHQPIEPWQRMRRLGEPALINADHIMASTAIPLLFPPAKVGQHDYGDGSLRNYTPLSPAIKMGAEKLLVLAVRRGMAQEDFLEYAGPLTSPGRIFSVLLNSILLDSIELDCERAQRINETVAYLRPWSGVPLKQVDVKVVRPSQDIGQVAFEEEASMPPLVRYLLKGLGKPEENEGLISYLLFEPSFTRRLLQMGYEDILSQKDEIRDFLLSS